MKFYNPFKAHIVYDNFTKCYRIRIFRLFFFEYMEANQYGNYQFFWYMNPTRLTSFRSEENAKKQLQRYKDYHKAKRFSVK